MPAVSSTLHPDSSAPPLPAWSHELGQIWERQQARVWERVDTIDDALTKLAADRLDPERRWQAIRAAHMLAGSLGMFGLHDASTAARRIELILTDSSAPADVPALVRELERLRDEVWDEVLNGVCDGVRDGVCDGVTWAAS